MAKNVIEVVAKGKDLVSGPFGKIGNKISSSLKEITKSVFSLRGAFGALAGAAGIGLLGRSVLQAASQMEDFKTRLISLTKSEELAEQKLRSLSEFAARAPFELPAIIEAGVTLEAFGLKAEAGIEPLGDLAAFMGIEIVDAAQAMGRAFAAGAGAADVLRERGVLNLVKMRTGIDDLTKLSLPEFRKALIESITDPAGKIAGATQRLAKTFTGQLSMMSDSTFQLRKNIGEALLPIMKKLITDRIVPLVKRLTEWAKKNKDLIKQKFENFLKGLIKVVTTLFNIVTKLVKILPQWWEENKRLVTTLTELLIAGVVAAKVTALAGAIQAAIPVFAGFIAVLTGAGSLTAAFLTLTPAITLAAQALALFVAFKVGEFLADVTFKLQGLSKEMKDISIRTATFRGEQEAALMEISFRTGILVTTWKELDAVVDAGTLRFSRAAGTWIKVAEAIKKTAESQKDLKASIDFGTESLEKQKKAIEKLATKLNELGKTDLKKLETRLEKELKLVKGNKELEFKVNEAHEERLRKLRDKSAKALGVITKEQIQQQLKDALQNFKNFTETEELTDREIIRLREGLFNKLKGIAESVGDTEIALGFKPEDVLKEIKRIHENLLGASEGTRKTLLDASGKTVDSLASASQITLKGFTESAKVLTDDTIKAVKGLINSLTNDQISSFGKLVNEINKYKNAYITAEEEITTHVEVESEKRLQIFKRFVETANGFRLEIGVGGAPINTGPPISPLGSVISPAGGANQTNNNQQFSININGQQGSSVEQTFDATRTLRRIQETDASLSF